MALTYSTNMYLEKKKGRLTDVENKLVVTGGWVGLFGMGEWVYKLLDVR